MAPSGQLEAWGKGGGGGGEGEGGGGGSVRRRAPERLPFALTGLSLMQ